MLKKPLVIATFVLFFMSLNAKAGWVLIEDEEDIRRVANNVHHFYQENASILEGEKEQVAKKVNMIAKSEDSLTREMIKDYRKNPKNFMKDLKQSWMYAQENESALKDRLGDFFYKVLLNGICFISQVIKASK